MKGEVLEDSAAWDKLAQGTARLSLRLFSESISACARWHARCLIKITMKKLIWALDAFQTDGSLQKSTIEFLKNLAESTGCKIEPVYLLSPDQLSISVEFSPPWIAHFQPAAEKALAATVKDTKIPGLMKPKVLIQKIPSLTHAVNMLNSYALSSGADAIVVATHAKKGLPRLFLGSFTESLLLSATIPVFTIGPSAKIRASANPHIVFATDLSKSSQLAYRKILRLAKDLTARLTLYHHIPNPIEPIFQSGVYLMGGGWVPASAYIKEESATLRKQLDRMAAQARRIKLRADVVVDSDGAGVTDGLLALAERQKISLVALASQSGPMAATLIGSIARQVVRASNIPVWVLHADNPKKKRKGVMLY